MLHEAESNSTFRSTMRIRTRGESRNGSGLRKILHILSSEKIPLYILSWERKRDRLDGGASYRRSASPTAAFKSYLGDDLRRYVVLLLSFHLNTRGREIRNSPRARK